MKPESIVNEAPATPERSALRITDDIDRKLAQASAILSLMGLCGRTMEALPDVTLENAAWAGRDLLKQAHDMVDELHTLAYAAQPSV